MIYLDYNATTPVDKQVLAQMMPYFAHEFGNPSSSHLLGRNSKKAINEAREKIRTALGAERFEVVFTASGTEANNMALKGAAHSLRSKGNHIIISAIEHPAIQIPIQFLQQNNCEVTIVPVDQYGIVCPQDIEKAITHKTVLISVMLANNEIGTIQPVKQIAAIARKRNILMHTDAAQAVGKMQINVADLGVDLMTIAGHKFYAPKGIGALLIGKGIKMEPLIHGAGHENGFRAGTENTPYIVGLAKALELSTSRIDQYQSKNRALRDRLQNIIFSQYPKAVLNGHNQKRLCNTLNISFPGIDSARLTDSIQDKIACSTGSACHEGKPEPSNVLLEIGRSKAIASSAIRLTLGWETTVGEIEAAGAAILKALQEIEKIDNNSKIKEMDKKGHWENIYQTKELHEVSWYQQVPQTSLDLLKKYNIGHDAKIIDIGGGDSYFVDHMLKLGYRDITVLDISEHAVSRAKARLGKDADKVNWIICDASDFKPVVEYDFWHDRAAFHFLTQQDDINAYLQAANQGISGNGILAIGTFSKSGPAKCSGIEIRQYCEISLKDQFSSGFQMIESFTVDHKTPFDTAQNFVFGIFKRS